MKNKFSGIFGILCLFCTPVFGQAVGTWTSHLAYNNATLIAETPNRVFAVFDGDLYSYSTKDQLEKFYSIENGLHGTNIQFLNYSPETKVLLIVYKDANIDIFAGDQEIYNLNAIKNKTNINNVAIHRHIAYLSSASGIWEVNLERKEIKENYLKNRFVPATCVWGEDLYAATTEGLFKAPLKANLLNIDIWEKLKLPSEINDKTINKMVVFDDHLIFDDQQSIWANVSPEEYKKFAGGSCRQLAVFNNQLVVLEWSAVGIYSNVNDPNDYFFLDDKIKNVSSVYSDGNYWVAWGSKGLTQISPDVTNHSYETTVPFIQSNSPLTNSAFRLNFSQNQLLVTGGGRNSNRYGNPGIFEVYENGHWKNYDAQTIAQQAGLPYVLDFMSAIVDPLDAKHYYVTSWGEGVYEFQDMELKNHYSYDNSKLQSIFPDASYRDNFVRVDGMAFDRNHNLYITNTEVSDGLVILDKDGNWHTVPNCEPLSGTDRVINQVIITRDNKKWVNIAWGKRMGLFVLDDKGTLDNAADNEMYFAGSFIDQQDRTIEITAYSCLTEDLNGQVWMGTDNGLVYFTSAEQVGQGRCNRLVGTDEHGEGKYVLEGEKITTIAVDGANRKWIGTTGSGVFMIDHSGTPKVINYTTKNSDILSDNINSIAINSETGEIFIATDQGICSYRSDATAGKPDYSEVHAFPNPVYSNRRALVTVRGLMSGSWVKVTDVAGNLMTEGYSQGGQYTWDCVTPRGETAKAGIYLVFAALPTGEQGVVTKFMVIR